MRGQYSALTKAGPGEESAGARLARSRGASRGAEEGETPETRRTPRPPGVMQCEALSPIQGA